MCKKSLRIAQMSSAAFVEEAAEKCRDLAKWETRGPGDLDNAMRRIEQKYRVDYWLQWALRYRTPKDITIGAYFCIANAHASECERQMRLFEHERSITKATGRLSSYLVRAADAVARKAD